jgi:lipid II:glycine glycyltransferase (peptidoglycan interpeptide bridge formation enzyme)
MNRDEYVQKLKQQLDQWNAEMANWESKAKEAQAGAQAEAHKRLDAFRARRDEAMQHMRQIQNASADAWADMMRGADEAWKAMGEAFHRARSHFDKK